MRTINVGDRVKIYYGEGFGAPDEAVVMHIPNDFGDWWYFKIDGKDVGLNPMSPALFKIEVIKGNLE